MRIRDILANPPVAQRYMERYVNSGSPSGFTQRYTSSPETSPFSDVPRFNLWGATADRNHIEDLGHLPAWLETNLLPIHPDMASHRILIANNCRPHEIAVSVSPTASARTVEVIAPAGGGYIKLHYDGLLGRVNRRLSRSHALAALDITDILDRASQACELPSQFGYFAERGARVATLIDEQGRSVEWGTVFREPEPKPFRKMSACLIPVFSLFSVDAKDRAEPPLLFQLAMLRQTPIAEYAFNAIKAIISCYFEMLLHYALQFECNAQNVVVGFSEFGDVVSVNFRDFESVDKDLSLVEELGLGVTFASFPFKCVHRGLYNYSIKHSFMYDFKLGEYVLAPIVNLLAATERPLVTARIRDLAHEYISRLPPGFFPTDGLWYNYANIVVDKTQERPYVGNRNPRYR